MGRKRHASEYLADSDSVSSASTSKMPSRSVRQKGVARMKSVGGLVLLRLIQSIALSLLVINGWIYLGSLPLIDITVRRRKRYFHPFPSFVSLSFSLFFLVSFEDTAAIVQL